MKACFHKALDKYKRKALKKPFMLNHFLYDSSLSQLNGLYTPFVLLPFGQWVFDKSPPFPGDRNPKREGSTNSLRFLLNLMNVQSSNIKIQSVGWYHLHDCAMAHQRFIFQESECWCPLKEDVKVDDGLGKLAFWKPIIKLDTSSEWATCIYSHFLHNFIR